MIKTELYLAPYGLIRTFEFTKQDAVERLKWHDIDLCNKEVLTTTQALELLAYRYVSFTATEVGDDDVQVTLFITNDERTICETEMTLSYRDDLNHILDYDHVISVALNHLYKVGDLIIEVRWDDEDN